MAEILGKRRALLLRSRLAQEQGWRCYYCGDVMTPAAGAGGGEPNTLTLDHVRPKAAGGKTTHSNTVAACLRCNRAKGDMRLTPEVRAAMRFEFEPRAAI